MANITVNITGYEDSNHCLLVDFSFEGIQTRTISVQPALYNADSAEDTMKKIAAVGMSYIKDQRLKDAYESNQSQINTLKALVGQSISFTETEIQDLSNLEVQV
jgi:hypothetical protein